uniref:Small integral membrane protein 14 n=1 Tax=Syphacia muris TaxID=451379 RepID=A0A0N5AAX6_9BILA
MSDPCECLFSHEAAMRRLLSLLRDSQGYCTDSECLRDGPGIDGNGLLQGNNLMVIVFLWTILAVVLYYLRPKSMRRSQLGSYEKPGPSSENPSGDPPAPEIH